MNNYDKINVPTFADGKEHGYLCSMCGQYTNKSESISYHGWNLICRKCQWKIEGIVFNHSKTILEKVQKVGKDRMEAESEDENEV